MFTSQPFYASGFLCTFMFSLFYSFFICLCFSILCHLFSVVLILVIWSRNDAGLAAAELALSVEKHVLESGSVDTVGTVGNPFCSIVISNAEILHSSLAIEPKMLIL